MFQQQGGFMNNFQRFLRVSICLIIITSGISYLYATASGRTGATQLNGSGCTCHSGSPNAGVSLVIAGPASLNPGQTGTYTVTTTRSSTITGAGINIAASSGTLIPMTNLKLSGSELTQTGAKSGTTSYVWNFQYTAPVTAGTQTLYATGCVSYSGGWNNAPNFTVNVATDTSSVTLTSPAGGESWRVGTAQNIKWFGGGTGNFRIELSTDNGTTWSDIAASVPPSPGSYGWTVPSSPSTQCLVRLTDVNNSLLTTTSKIFTILENSTGSEVLLEENFDDPTKTATLISGFNGWGTVTGTTSGTQVSFSDSNLVFAGYPEGSGRAAVTSVATHKIYKNFTAPTSGVIYLSYLIKIPTASQTSTNHIIGFGSGDMSATATYSLKTYCKWNAGTTGYIFGLTTGSTSTYSATPTTLPAGKVGLVVIRYDIDANTEDIYVFPEGTTYPTTLPGTPEVHLTGGTVFVPSCVYIRSQSGSGSTITSILDGIRVSTSWGQITTDVKQIAKENQSFKLMQNYPNPFNPSTTINYQINQDSPVTLKVFNMLGKEVASLVNEFKAVGSYKVQFNASNLSSGVYYTELRSGSSVQVNKMILMK